MELTANTVEGNQMLLEHKCPFNLPEFPQLNLPVECPDGVEQCAPINFCRTSQSKPQSYIYFSYKYTTSGKNTLSYNCLLT